MDVAASIAGLVSLGIQVTQALVDYYTAYKNHEAEVASTTKKLNRLLNMLKTLHAYLDGRKFKDDEKDLQATIESAVQDCKEYIHELKIICDKLVECDSAGGIRAKAALSARKLAYPFRKSTLHAIEEDVDDTASHVSLALQMLQLKGNDQIQDDVADNKALLGLIHAGQVSSEIRGWLRAPDVSINYNEACKKRHRGTGLWLTKSDAFSNWLVKPNSFLWLYGFAGCGKSVLCSTAIQHTLQHRRSNPRIGLAFFFFTFTDNDKQDTSAMLRALVLQLSNQCGDGYDHLSRLHKSYPNGMPPDQALIDCLRRLVQSFDETYLILDALDESPRNTHRVDLLRALADMRSWSEPGLHLLVTSRDEVDIRDVLHDHLGTLTEEKISLKNDGIDRDIASYISGALETDHRLRKWERYHDQIKQVLTERAKGVFRWVECQFIALASCPGSKNRLSRLLKSLPQTLDKTYERMLLNLDDDTKDDARRILTLLCCARRPLSVAEVLDAAAIQLGDHPHFDMNERLFGEEDLLNICPGLIEIATRKALWGDVTARHEIVDKTGNIIAGVRVARIAHFSVQEYLESERIRQQPLVARFGIIPSDAHVEMASICVAYLHDVGESFDSPAFPFARYAVQNWSSHYHCGTQKDQNSQNDQNGQKDQDRRQLQQLIIRLLPRTDGDTGSWNIRMGCDIKFYGLPGYFYRSEQTEPLVVFLAFHGLFPILAELLQSNPPAWFDPGYIPQLVNTRSKRLGMNTPLTATIWGLSALNYNAARENYVRTLRFLIEMGANVNADDCSLYTAARNGYADIVHLLLDHGAEIDVSNKKFQSVLDVALLRHQDGIAQLLLDRGAAVNAHVSSYGCALQAAAHRGNNGIVQQLINRGADVNAQGGDDGSALQAAVAGGHKATFHLLLDNGADIHATGGRYGSTLQAAAARGDVRIVRRLLDKGADMHEPDGEYGTAVQAAAANGHQDIFQLLLGRGADIDSRGGPYGSMLQAAASGGNREIIQLLLNRGADVNASGGRHGSVLQAAAAPSPVEIEMIRAANRKDSYHSGALLATEKNCESITRLLLDHGADVNAAGGAYDSVLQTAVRWREVGTIQLLLDHGADVNARGGNLGSVLYKAACRGKLDIARLLLDHGANANARDEDSGNALREAVYRKNVCMVRLLLDHGADINALGSALGEAVFREDVAMVRLLLDHGADINARGGEDSALQEAVHWRRVGMICLLLDRGADVNVLSDEEKDAMQILLDTSRMRRRRYIH